MKKLIKLILLTFPFISSLAATPLTTTEQEIIHYVTQKQDNQLALLEKLVNINSGTTNTTGVKKVGKIIEPLFKSLGFHTRWVNEPASMHRAPTFIAEREGHQGKRLLLIGHLDTVFAKNSPFQHFERHDKRATGPGVIDDKGGDVVILYALQALHAVHALEDTTIRVVLTGDEEDSGKPTSISRKPLFEAAKQSDIALDFECEITQDTATIARRGISMWTINAQGTQAHSAGIFKPGIGYGAVYELSRILNGMQEHFAKDPDLSLNAALVLGGTELQYDKNDAKGRAAGKENVVAKTAMATGDLRFVSEEQKEAAIKQINAIIDQHLPGTTAQLSMQDGIPSMSPTEANLALLKQYSAISDSLGFGEVKPLAPNVRGAGDISHIASMVSASLAGLGPMGVGAHSVQEALDIPSLTMQTQRAAIFIYQLTQGSSQSYQGE